MDADPGDVLYLSARLSDGSPLPGWLRFDERRHRFEGRPPEGCTTAFTVTVVASDVDGLTASSSFELRAVVHRGS